MEDAKIVELYWQRDQEAIRETDNKYGPYCLSIARNILQNAQDAEECLNDSYMAAWNAMPDKWPARLAPFMGRITRNLSLNRLERQNRLKRGGGQTELCLEELSECIPAYGGVEQQIEAKELGLALRRFMERLSAEERRMFTGRYFYVRSVEETAALCACSPGKVKTCLHRVRKKLKIFLEEEELWTL